ncbi:hypothetical protein BV20DRAFT_973964 [Pilatotrama ljubarskyi]|nr:hypothetical protein BV20DRAFT_973964 [Pilatotrama ljubarskyi]
MVEELRASGVEIRLGDLQDGIYRLKEVLQGMGIPIRAVDGKVIPNQEDVLRAVKEVGAIERVVLCDFGTPEKKDLRETHDQKLDIRELVKELGLPHTFVDVSWWMQLGLPLSARSKAPAAFQEWTYELHGICRQKMLLTDYRDIGAYVARIVTDPRTLIHAVIIWKDEVTEEKIHAIAERLSREGNDLKTKPTYVSGAEILKCIADGKKQLVEDPSNVLACYAMHWNGYMYGMDILGENTLESTMPSASDIWKRAGSTPTSPSAVSRSLRGSTTVSRSLGRYSSGTTNGGAWMRPPAHLLIALNIPKPV